MASSANLGQHLEAYVSNLIKAGRYNSRSEVLREGIRLGEERENGLRRSILRLHEALRMLMLTAANRSMTSPND